MRVRTSEAFWLFSLKWVTCMESGYSAVLHLNWRMGHEQASAATLVSAIPIIVRGARSGIYIAFNKILMC